MAGRRAHGVEPGQKIARRRATEKSSSAGAAEALLRLQETAGNQAVAQLARQAAPPKTQPTTTGGATVEIEDIGTLKALSISLAEKNTLHVTAETSDLSPILMKYAAEGKKIPKVVVRLAGVTYTLTDVYVSNFSTGGSGNSNPVDQIAFTYGNLESDYLGEGSSGGG
jgi:hypothetical protein